jgi:hypothetical protein
MQLEKKEYLLIKNINEIGNFYVVDNLYLKNINNITPVFKILNENNDLRNYKLITGNIDIDGQFYHTPILISYLKINYITIKKDDGYEQRNIVEMNVNIFNKKFTENLNLTTKIKTGNHSDIILNIYQLFVKINLLNKYINLDNTLEDLDILKLEEDFKPISQENLISIINKLNFHYYENSKYRPRKDNDDIWIELEVNELPENKYLKKLLINHIGEEFDSLNNIEEENCHLFITNHFDNNLISSFGRRPLDMDGFHAKKYKYYIKDLIKFKILKNFNIDLYMSSWFKN